MLVGQRNASGRLNSRLYVLLNLLAASLLFANGCNRVPDQDKTPAAQDTTKASQLTTAIEPYRIDLFDMVMARSRAYKVSGDLRPIWIVSGRLRNNTALAIGHVRLHISLIDKRTNSEVDGSDLDLVTNIRPWSVGSFSQEVQVLPPNKPWYWKSEAVHVESLPL